MLRIRRLNCEQLEVRCVMTAENVFGNEGNVAFESPMHAALSSTPGLFVPSTIGRNVGHDDGLSPRFTDVNLSYFQWSDGPEYHGTSSDQHLVLGSPQSKQQESDPISASTVQPWFRDANSNSGLLSSLRTTVSTYPVSIVQFCCSWLTASTSSDISTSTSSSGGISSVTPVFVAFNARQATGSSFVGRTETVLGPSFELSPFVLETYRAKEAGGIGNLLPSMNPVSYLTDKIRAAGAAESAIRRVLLNGDSTEEGFIEFSDSLNHEPAVAIPWQMHKSRQVERDFLLAGTDGWRKRLQIGDSVEDWTLDVNGDTISDGLHDNSDRGERLAHDQSHVVRSSVTATKAIDDTLRSRTFVSRETRQKSSESIDAMERSHRLGRMIWLSSDPATAECGYGDQLSDGAVGVRQFDGTAGEFPFSWTIGQAQAFEMDRGEISPATRPQQVASPQSGNEVVHEEPKEALPAPHTAAICIPLIMVVTAARPSLQRFSRQKSTRSSKTGSIAIARNEIE